MLECGDDEEKSKGKVGTLYRQFLYILSPNLLVNTLTKAKDLLTYCFIS